MATSPPGFEGIDAQRELMDAITDHATTPEQALARVKAIIEPLQEAMGQRSDPFHLTDAVADALSEALGITIRTKGWLQPVAKRVGEIQIEAEIQKELRKQQEKLSVGGGPTTSRFSLDGHPVKIVEQTGPGTVLVEFAGGRQLETLALKLSLPGGNPGQADGWVEGAIREMSDAAWSHVPRQDQGGEVLSLGHRKTEAERLADLVYGPSK